ncbi:MAG: bifunctional ornithine acetyltransferase/N-acetylglutamate synthase, partial [Verrucomicrobiia bacterium]
MKPGSFAKIKGGVCAPNAFLAGGIHCGVKSNAKDLDLAIVFSTAPAATAATFTTNRVKAAPVRVSMAHLKLAGSRAIVANSGNANACTGPDGMKHARMMAASTAKALGLSRSDVLVCSTGRIGVLLPIARIEKGIAKLARKLSPNGGRSAARGIMTSDTVPKEYALEFKIGKTAVRRGGMAKGAGMIDPNMATMLAFLTTDVAISDRDLQKALGIAVDQSFNRITVDGDMSTNDTVICIANGQWTFCQIGKSKERLFNRFKEWDILSG